MQYKLTLFVSSVVCLVASIGLFMSHRWLAGFALAVFTLVMNLYWLRPAGRVRRRTNAPIVWDGNQLGLAVGLFIIGLGSLVKLGFEIASSEALPSVFLLGFFTMGCWLLAFRYITFVRLETTLKESLPASPIVIGTGDAISSRLRAIGLEPEGLVAVESSAFGKPLTFHRISLQEIVAIDEPALGAVRVNAGANGSFLVRRGSPKAAQQLKQELTRRGAVIT